MNREKAMAPHSSTVAWKIPWMEEPGGLQSMGSLRSWTRLSDFTFTFHFHALEKEMAAHSSVLAWRIPWMEKPGGLPSMGLHRVGHDWSDLAGSRWINIEQGCISLMFSFFLTQGQGDCSHLTEIYLQHRITREMKFIWNDLLVSQFNILLFTRYFFSSSWHVLPSPKGGSPGKNKVKEDRYPCSYLQMGSIPPGRKEDIPIFNSPTL